jgi:tRNA-dihydrouridine synthase A
MIPLHHLNSGGISTAPMIDWTDRHCRYFFRLLHPQAVLYTEMISTGAIIHGDAHRHLQTAPCENPTALQLGGANPHDLAQAIRIANHYDYQEYNLNVGCPSDRVQNGAFGACLMAKPELVAQCLTAMYDAAIPYNRSVSIKHRTGIDDFDSYEFLADFVGTLADKSPCRTFIIHARKAWLQGLKLSPKQNREIPPLHYDWVYRLKQEFPHLHIIINGGIKSKNEVNEHLKHVDGVMIGRWAYEDPYALTTLNQLTLKTPSRKEVLEQVIHYLEQENIPLKYMARHVLGLFHQCPNNRLWKQNLSIHKNLISPHVLLEYLPISAI